MQINEELDTPYLELIGLTYLNVEKYNFNFFRYNYNGDLIKQVDFTTDLNITGTPTGLIFTKHRTSSSDIFLTGNTTSDLTGATDVEDEKSDFWFVKMSYSE
jgi:hypothetical protein